MPAMLLALAPLALPAAEPQTKWQLANFTWVKRVPAEPDAAANAHPAALSPEALQALLGPVQATVDGQPTPLFAPGELKALAKALAEALAQAQPGDDLVLLSTYKRGGGFMEPSIGLTARLFVQDGALNLLVHDARLAFMDRYAAEHTLPEFAYGSRKAASGARLQAPGARAQRPDWLTLPLPASPAAAVVAPVVVAPGAAPAPAPAPAPAAAEARDAAFYEAQSQRLKALKKMRDEGLLSEAEYQQKREAILKTL
jgi:hypothetical protein